MTNRRDAMGLGVGAALGALLTPWESLAMTMHKPNGRLETGLFNFKDGTSEPKAAEAIATLKELAHASGAEASLFGRNLDATPFAARMEWIYMVQYAAGTPPRNPGAIGELQNFRESLAPWVKDIARCDIRCPLPSKYGEAPGVGVRHVVMFSFKPDASREARDRNVEAIRRMGQLPMVQHYLVEPSAAKGASPDQMEWQVVGDFANFADFKAYADAPVHLAIREDFTAHTSRVAFLDVNVPAP
jgi:hypothetical protein